MHERVVVQVRALYAKWLRDGTIPPGLLVAATTTTPATSRVDGVESFVREAGEGEGHVRAGGET
jgi:hypothetical protein